MITRPCEWCQTVFTGYTRKSRPAPQFCSKRCHMAFNHFYLNPIIAWMTAEQRGDMLRGRGEGKTYPKRGGKHEHRYVMEKHLGRGLLCTEVVHHIDGNIRNNAIENLKLMTRVEHINEHRAAMTKARNAGEAWRKGVAAALASRGIKRSAKSLRCRSK